MDPRMEAAVTARANCSQCSSPSQLDCTIERLAAGRGQIGIDLNPFGRGADALSCAKSLRELNCVNAASGIDGKRAGKARQTVDRNGIRKRPGIKVDGQGTRWIDKIGQFKSCTAES